MQGGKLEVVNPPDLIGLFMAHPKMKTLTAEASIAYVQRETGATAGLERAVQAATAPSLGQQMLQQGYAGGIADGVSREVVSNNIDVNGQQCAQRLVERAVVLPSGQGVHIQQVQQHITDSDSNLGKRKTQEDLQRVETCERDLQCDARRADIDKLRADIDKQKADNKDKQIALVEKFARVMTSIQPDWMSQDKRLVLQTQDFLKNALFGESSTMCAVDSRSEGSSVVAMTTTVPSAALASISISQIATEMKIRLSRSQLIAVGKVVRNSFKEKYGIVPSKHNQFVDGAVRSVNSYTEQHRALLENALQSL